MAEARIKALKDNQEEFGHDVRDLKKHISKLLSLMETKEIILEANPSQPSSKVSRQLGQDYPIFNHERLDAIAKGTKGMGKQVMELKYCMIEVESKIINKDFVATLPLPTASQNGYPSSSTTELSSRQSHQINASPQIPNIAFTPVLYSILTTSPQSNTQSVSNQNRQFRHRHQPPYPPNQYQTPNTNFIASIPTYQPPQAL